MRPLKVWGGMRMLSAEELAQGDRNMSRQARCIVAARSQKRAAELVEESLYSFRGWWAETGNATELAVATEEGVWVAPDQARSSAADYRRLK